MDLSNKTITYLPLALCALLNIHNEKYQCSTEEDNPNCIYCEHFGKFLISGEDEDAGISLLPSRILFVLVFITGIVAILLNTIIVTILRKQWSRRSFDTLLLALAIFDLVASVFSVIAATSMLIFFENWSKNYYVLLFYLIGGWSYLFVKSGSSWMTVTIAAERYMAIAFPFQKARWCTPENAIFMAIFSGAFSLLLSIPRFGGKYLVKNEIGKGIACIEDLDYLVVWSELGLFFVTKMNMVQDKIDLLLQPILLLILTAMTFYEIRKFSKNRVDHQDVKQRKEIRAGKTFIPVVIVFFLCNIVITVLGSMSFYYETIYRETLLLALLSCVINSSANLPIYYLKSNGFRKQAKLMVSSWRKMFSGKDRSGSVGSAWYCAGTDTVSTSNANNDSSGV